MIIPYNSDIRRRQLINEIAHLAMRSNFDRELQNRLYTVARALNRVDAIIRHGHFYKFKGMKDAKS
jgi:hypothetical protein